MDRSTTDNWQQPRIVSPQQWLQERIALLRDEKAFTRARDELMQRRRALPWVKIDKRYLFDTRDGARTLTELFDGRSQLIVKHFMFGPGWKEGCVGCSFESDHIDAARQHFEHHDVSFIAVSRAPLEEFEPFRQRMGWQFNWVSSFDCDFNYDFNVSFTPEQMTSGHTTYNYREEPLPIDELSGFSVFYRDEHNNVFHTYSTFGRGAEEILGTYMLLDLTPKGRNETGPGFNLTDWVRHHDRYGESGRVVSNTGRWETTETCPACHETR